MTNEEFEKLYSAKLAEREYPFSPKSWEAMEQLLDQRALSKGFYTKTSLATVGFGLIVASLIAFAPVSENDITGPLQTKELIVNQLPEAVINIEKEAAPTETKSIEALEDQTIQETTPINTSPIASANEAQFQPKAQETPVLAESVTAQSELSVVSLPEDITPATIQEPENDLSDNKTEVVPSTSIADLSVKGFHQMGIGKPNYQLVSPQSLPELDPLPPLINRSRGRHQIYFEGGLNFNESYRNSDLGTGWLAGLHYTYRLNNRWALSSGARYVVQDNVGLKETSDSTFRTFGFERIQTIEEVQRFDYLEVPLTIGYNITPRHLISVGGYYSTLVAVHQKTSVNHSSFSGGTQEKTTTSTDVTDDFVNYDTGLLFDYQFNFNSRLNFGASFKYGLMDVSMEQGDQRILNTRLLVRYRLF